MLRPVSSSALLTRRSTSQAVPAGPHFVATMLWRRETDKWRKTLGISEKNRLRHPGARPDSGARRRSRHERFALLGGFQMIFLRARRRTRAPASTNSAAVSRAA